MFPCGRITEKYLVSQCNGHNKFNRLIWNVYKKYKYALKSFMGKVWSEQNHSCFSSDQRTGQYIALADTWREGAQCTDILIVCQIHKYIAYHCILNMAMDSMSTYRYLSFATKINNHFKTYIWEHYQNFDLFSWWWKCQSYDFAT